MDRPDTPSSLPPGTMIGEYVIEARIGVGGFGEVFRARHSKIDRTVALKILHAKYSSDPEAVARVLDEARAVNQISHPGIVDIFGFAEHTGRALIVMELIEGTLLRDLLRERGCLPLAEALPILRGIAEAVDAAHAANIAHRDLKPDNVFVLEGDRTKLIDFGLAKLVREQEPVTQSGSIFGTPLYMSPEQCRGGKIDTRTDLYSFGALAYHVLVGEPPFGGDPIELALHHVNDRPETPSKRRRELSRTVDRVVLALLAKDPSERPPSLTAAVDALAGTARLRRSRKGLAYAALAATGVGLAGLGVSKLAAREPDAGGECATAADRISPIWNPAMRDAIGAHFASTRPDVRHAWKLTQEGLDGATARWSAQWDHACRALDRSTEPLLYAQRIACLETALVGLRNTVDTLQSIDVIAYTEGQFGPGYVDLGTGRRGLIDCESTAVLRAQVPPPPVAVRPRIATLRLAADRATEQGWNAYTKRDVPGLDRAAAELDKIGREIEVIDAASATDAILSRGELLIAIAWDKDVARLTAARVAMTDAIRRIEASRDDVALAHAYLLIAGIEMASLHRPDVIERALDAVGRAHQAVTRAGEPIYARLLLAQTRADLGMARGKLLDAVVAYREAARLAEEIGTDPMPYELGWVTALARGEQLDEAKQTMRAVSRRLADRFGPDAAQTIWAGTVMSNLLALGGDHEGALAERRVAVARYAKTTSNPSERKTWGTAYVVELALRAGQSEPDETIRILRALASLGTVPPHHNPDGIATARRAGLFETFAFGATHTGITGEDEHHDHLATLAFQRDDLAGMAKHAAVTVASCAKRSCTSWIRFSRWLALLADAKAGRASDLAASLDVLEREHAIPSAFAYSGIVLAKLGRWKEALVKLETARAEPAKWEFQADLTELDTWLGLARFEAGDREGARAAFEEALRVIAFDRNGVEGFSYMTPVAQISLASLLWDEGSRERGRKLAVRAGEGFARLGLSRDGVTRWLADH